MELPPPFYADIGMYKEKQMNVTWKMVALGIAGIVGIVAVSVTAMANGIDGVLAKAAFVFIGVIVAGIGGYTIGIKRKAKE